MSQHNVIYKVVDTKGMLHYAIPVDSTEKHPAAGNIWTIGCSQIAGTWESGDKMEEIYQLVQSVMAAGTKLKNELKFSTNRKVAEVMATFAARLLPMLNYHRDICSKCNEALVDDSQQDI